MDYELAGFFLYQGISIRMIFSYITYLTLPFAKDFDFSSKYL